MALLREALEQQLMVLTGSNEIEALVLRVLGEVSILEVEAEVVKIDDPLPELCFRLPILDPSGAVMDHLHSARLACCEEVAHFNSIEQPVPLLPCRIVLPVEQNPLAEIVVPHFGYNVALAIAE